MPSHEADNCCSLKTNNKDPDYGRRKNYMDNFIHILLLAVTADKPNPDYGSQDKNKHKRACTVEGRPHDCGSFLIVATYI